MRRRGATCGGQQHERDWLECGLIRHQQPAVVEAMTLIPPPDNDARPQPPEAPGPNECCGSGCPLCVLDLYADELGVYRKRLAEWLLRHPEAQESA